MAWPFSSEVDSSRASVSSGKAPPSRLIARIIFVSFVSRARAVERIGKED